MLPTKYDCNFSPTKTYLLSGCLGGIGRSITKWMMKRGAKNFAMIGRSGLDKEPAQRLVKDLKDAGADVSVTRGDVGDVSVVEKAVATIEGEIGGVVQAAMGLDVCSLVLPSSFSFSSGFSIFLSTPAIL
jgi:NAD(P)-dependent dehydrogenase (short-subunit alcohol dehydrogenase family)